ncbi:MAG TPA: exosortase F system-associated protein [Flavobacterium sp.]|jgi:exosortase F-associated protein
MLQNLLKSKSRMLILLLCVLALVLVRTYEDALFYDPMLDYFRSDFSGRPLPKTDQLALLLNLLFRYFLNSAISLVMIYVLFRNFGLAKFAGILYVIFFIILLAGFVISLNISAEGNKMIIFYIRRFLIQPLFLLLFIPAFYLQERASEKNNIP